MQNTGFLCFPFGRACSTFIVACSLLVSACSKESLKALDLIYDTQSTQTEVRVNFCTAPAQFIQAHIKYIFVMDKSGSNRQNYRMNPDGSMFLPLDIQDALGTDPIGDRRYGELVTFLQTSDPNDPLRHYALVNFSNNGSVVPVGGKPDFTTDRDAFLDVVQNQYSNIADQGATNYEDALNKVYGLIDADIARTKANPNDQRASSYIIVMVSDGRPIISIQPQANPMDPPKVTEQSSADIIKKVKNLVALQANVKYVDSISLFTGYYFVNGNEDPNARQLLKDMADAGNGVAYEFGTGKVVDFSLFTVPSKLLKTNLSEIFVTNASANWWDDNQLSLDTDLDGLPNRIEERMHSNPLVADSDGNGVGDAVEFRLYGTPCLSANCATSQRRNFLGAGSVPPDPLQIGGCGLASHTTTRGLVSFVDSDSDALNDCEEILLGNSGGSNNPDSNGDFIVDWLSFVNHVEFSAGHSTAASDPDSDGVPTYFEIKNGMPAFLPNYQLLHPPSLKYDLTLNTSSVIQNCYTLKVTEFPTLGPDNMVRVYFFESNNVILNQTTLHIGEKRFSGDSKTLVFDGPTNEAAGVWK